MDTAVIQALARWPNVPDCYDWLMLDRRGRWRLRHPQDAMRFEPIQHAELRDYIARNYSVDASGAWYFQNGPQKVFVRLAYTPWVLRFEGGALVNQCGEIATPHTAWLDEEGSLLLLTQRGVGLLDDRDLATFADDLAQGFFKLEALTLVLSPVLKADVPSRFGFVLSPGAPT